MRRKDAVFLFDSIFVKEGSVAEAAAGTGVAVSESGIRTADDIRRLSDAGYCAFLVGEHLMRALSPGDALAELLPRRTHAAGRVS